MEAGAILGWLDIRVGPQERLDLVSKLAEARAKLQGAEAVLKIRQERVKRFHTGPVLRKNDTQQSPVQRRR
jgi:hypothetical protein